MANDISISVKVANNSGAEFTALNTSLRTLKTNAGNAATGMRTLTTRTGAANLSIKSMKRSADDTALALDSLRTSAGDITVRATIHDDTTTGADQVKAAIDDLKRLGPVRLDVTFSGAAGDITATSDSLRSLKDNARDAGLSTQTLGTRAEVSAAKLELLKVAAGGAADKLDELRNHAALAAVALAELRARAASSATAVGSLRNRADAAGSRVTVLSGHTRTLTADLDTMGTSATHAGGSLSGLSGRIGSVSSSSNQASGSASHLTGALLSLAPAAVPVAASLAPMVAATGAAVIGLAALGAAVIPQVKKLSDLSAAMDTLASAQGQAGAASKKSIEEQQKASAALAGVPEETKRAAAAFGILRNDFNAWSDDLADFTMDPVTKSFAVVDAILPKFTPLAKGAAGQLDRLMTVAGGAVETRGFDTLMGKLDTYSNKVLKGAVDETVHFSRVLSQGDADNSAIAKFMDYARSQGPAAKELLEDLSKVLAHVTEAAADAGPGMLTVVDSLAKLIGAIPPALLGRLMQLYTAFKLIKLSSAGLVAVGTGASSLATKLGALRTASAGAGGGLAGVRAALATLSTGTKVAGALAVVAGVVLVMKQLSSSKDPAPNVDRLTTALGNFGRTGKLGGEAARVLGKDFGDLNAAVDRLSGGGSKMDHFNDSMNKVLSLGMAKSNSAKAAAKDIDGIDKALANLVSGGHADLAAEAVDRLSKEYAKTGKPTSQLTSKLDDYKSALADAKFESDLTADSMGLFGRQAQATQKQLDAQKQSADGLRQSIQALNDVNRAGLSAESDFEQAIDDATAAVKGHHHALTEVHGALDLNTQAARDAYKPLSDLAEKTDAAGTAARDQGKSWETVFGIYDRGRSKLISVAQQMGLTKNQAKALADQILKTPDKTAHLRGNIADLQAKINTAKKQLASLPKSRSAAVRADSSQLKNVIRDAQARINRLRGKTVPIIIQQTYTTSGTVYHEGGGYAHGGVVGAATGGPRSRLTLVGEQGPELVDLAAGSRVHTANATKQMLAGGVAGGGGSMRPIVVQLMLDGRILAERMVEPTRDLVLRKGRGDVQQMYGKRAG
ncbi:hypothetical protein [Streptomyces sp. CA-111067]|uniref:hypothetical protein n=1 Tax=Streptomyces sp. CA-111067 TaxID=3240046 RepID=UPI003D981E92